MRVELTNGVLLRPRMTAAMAMNKEVSHQSSLGSSLNRPKHAHDLTHPTAPTNPFTSLFNPATAVAYPRRTSGPRAVLNMIDGWCCG